MLEATEQALVKVIVHCQEFSYRHVQVHCKCFSLVYWCIFSSDRQMERGERSSIELYVFHFDKWRIFRVVHREFCSVTTYNEMWCYLPGHHSRCSSLLCLGPLFTNLFMGANLNASFQKKCEAIRVAIFHETDMKYFLSLEPVLSSLKFFINMIIKRYNNAMVT